MKGKRLKRILVGFSMAMVCMLAASCTSTDDPASTTTAKPATSTTTTITTTEKVKGNFTAVENLAVSDAGVLSWTAKEDATNGYTVMVGEETKIVNTNSLDLITSELLTSGAANSVKVMVNGTDDNNASAYSVAVSYDYVPNTKAFIAALSDNSLEEITVADLAIINTIITSYASLTAYEKTLAITVEAYNDLKAKQCSLFNAFVNSIGTVGETSKEAIEAAEAVLATLIDSTNASVTESKASLVTARAAYEAVFASSLEAFKANFDFDDLSSVTTEDMSALEETVDSARAYLNTLSDAKKDYIRASDEYALIGEYMDKLFDLNVEIKEDEVIALFEDYNFEGSIAYTDVTAIEAIVVSADALVEGITDADLKAAVSAAVESFMNDVSAKLLSSKVTHFSTEISTLIGEVDAETITTVATAESANSVIISISSLVTSITDQQVKNAVIQNQAYLDYLDIVSAVNDFVDAERTNLEALEASFVQTIEAELNFYTMQEKKGEFTAAYDAASSMVKSELGYDMDEYNSMYTACAIAASSAKSSATTDLNAINEIAVIDANFDEIIDKCETLETKINNYPTYISTYIGLEGVNSKVSAVNTAAQALIDETITEIPADFKEYTAAYVIDGLLADLEAAIDTIETYSEYTQERASGFITDATATIAAITAEYTLTTPGTVRPGGFAVNADGGFKFDWEVLNGANEVERVSSAEIRMISTDYTTVTETTPYAMSLLVSWGGGGLNYNDKVNVVGISFADIKALMIANEVEEGEYKFVIRYIAKDGTGYINSAFDAPTTSFNYVWTLDYLVAPGTFSVANIGINAENGQVTCPWELLNSHPMLEKISAMEIWVIDDEGEFTGTEAERLTKIDITWGPGFNVNGKAQDFVLAYDVIQTLRAANLPQGSYRFVAKYVSNDPEIDDSEFGAVTVAQSYTWSEDEIAAPGTYFGYANLKIDTNLGDVALGEAAINLFTKNIHGNSIASMKIWIIAADTTFTGAEAEKIAELTLTYTEGVFHLGETVVTKISNADIVAALVAAEAEEGEYKLAFKFISSDEETVASSDFSAVTNAYEYLWASAKTNLALEKTAYASSGNAALAVDGDAGTRWESVAQDDQWILVDLGSEVEVSSLKVIWEAARSKDYDVLYYTGEAADLTSYVAGEDWSVAHSVENADPGVLTDEYDLATPVTTRYIVLDCKTRCTGYGHSIFELMIY